MNTYGSIDLTLLGRIVRQHPDLVRSVQLKNGETHQFINVNVDEHNLDAYSNVGAIRVACKKDDRKDGLNYFLANLKPSRQVKSSSPEQSIPTQVQAPPAGEGDLPF